MNITNTSIDNKLSTKLCKKLKRQPASEQATKVVVMASALDNPERELSERLGY